ncbi:hypothetical protein BFR04_14080 [Gaetbulibacter sp. 4G1]|nr:DUF3179 domain-containing (seleno)protein [Gaetbulibacter sp. 4G1]PIA81844.1 hypothetical protein BFR04_14080 [Gaetbulibacter sp. 4G1]
MKRFIILTFILLVNCSTETSVKDNTDEVADNLWCVPKTDIAGGGSYEIKENPDYKSISEIDATGFLNDNSRLALLKINGQVYAYPYDYTNNFEVINDTFGDIPLAITYCPITESALSFDRRLPNGETITMKASGFLYKDNLIATDADLNYYWSQMAIRGLRESTKDIRLNTYNIIESYWLGVKTHFPNAMVFNHPDVANCNCDETPVPIDFNNLLGVMHEHVFDDIVHLFSYSNFANGIEIDYTSVNSKNVIVVGSKEKVYFNAFYLPSNLTFTALDTSEFPNVLTDNEGNIWDAFGYAVSGNRQGQKLDSPKSYVAAEWAFKDIFKELVYH